MKYFTLTVFLLGILSGGADQDNTMVYEMGYLQRKFRSIRKYDGQVIIVPQSVMNEMVGFQGQPAGLCFRIQSNTTYEIVQSSIYISQETWARSCFIRRIGLLLHEYNHCINAAEHARVEASLMYYKMQESDLCSLPWKVKAQLINFWLGEYKLYRKSFTENPRSSVDIYETN